MADKADEVKISIGKQFISVDISCCSDRGLWRFCKNGYQATGIYITREQFEMLRELVTNADVVDYYEAQQLTGE